MRLSIRGLRIALLALPLFALACNGSSPTEPLQAEPQPKGAVSSASGAGQVAPGVSVEDGAPDERRPGAARLARAAAGARPVQRVDGEKPADPAGAIVETARGGRGNGNGNGGGNGGGNGNGGGHGNGGGGNGNGGGNGGNGGNGGGRGGELTLDVQPQAWNTNWTRSEGTVQAFVRGRDVGKIDVGSVELVVAGGALAPERARIAGGQLVAHFDKSEAFELLGDDIGSGDRVEVTLRFTVDGETRELTDTIRIVGPDPGDGGDDDEEGDPTLKISPDDWNTNWARSAGQVHAFLRGPGLADIDLDSIRLVGDDPDAEALEPLDVRRVGHQIVARFSKRAAYATLDDPDSGETHTVRITFQQGDENKELSADVHIVGP